MVRLVFHVGNREPVELDLKPGVYSLGSGEGNTIVVDLPEVSPEHIAIRITESLQVFLRDVGEDDGLRVNGQQVTESFVKPGDLVTAGSMVIAVEPVVNRVSESGAGDSNGDRVGFFASIPGAFRYPFTNDSAFIVAGVVVVLGVSNVLGGLMFWVGALLGLAVGIFLLSLFREIILATVHGEDAMPSEQSMSFDWDEIKETLLPFYALVLLAAVPIHYSRYLGQEWLQPFLGLMAFLYIPMGILLIGVTGEFLAANPFNVVLSIVRAPLGYLGVLLTGLPVIGLVYFTDSVLWNRDTAEPPSRIVISILSLVVELFEIYFLFVWARILGLYYRFYRHRLCWEEVD